MIPINKIEDPYEFVQQKLQNKVGITKILYSFMDYEWLILHFSTLPIKNLINLYDKMS